MSKQGSKAQEGQDVGNEGNVERGLFRSIMIIVGCTLAMISNSVNNTSVAIALPTIEHGLHMGPIDLQWVVSGYSLSSGCLLLLLGRLADLHGRKKAYVLGSIWLVAFTLGCVFVRDPLTLNVLRGIQGIGAAATIPAAIGILAHSFPPGQMRAIAFASFGAGAPVGAAFGSAIGGVLTQLTQPKWRSTFYFSAALTFVSLVVGLLAFDKDLPSTEPDQRIDWIGAILCTSGLVLIVFALGQGEIAPQRWKTPYIIVFLIIGILFMVLFLLWQHHLEMVQHEGGHGSERCISWLPTPPSLMPLSLWMRAKGRVSVVMWIAFLLWASFISWNYWALLYYQDFTRLSPILTMVRIVPMFVTGVLCNIFVALVVGYVPLVYLMGLGTAITSTASLLFALINPKAPYWAFGFPAAILSVFGADFVFTAGTLFIAKVALPHQQSVAGGIFQCMTQLGTSLGITVSTVVFNNVLHKDSMRRHLPPPPDARHAPRPVQLECYHAAFWTTFAFGVLATILAVLFLRGVGIVGQRRGAKKSGEAENGEMKGTAVTRQPSEKDELEGP
ncbi:efflux transporter [Moniliophthora roreri MCA 2997]|uniref:Efflux transporter n=1 Tax=Moniliophthora roreri (strain MCA 2997) TaxID=1381753 RepID=V2XEP9_MONRO|nr:efflux transporter [Moniliophthora roreri MCA 2997]